MKLRGRIVKLVHTLLLLAFTGLVQAAESPRPLRLGIMPFNSTLALIKTHQPLVHYLEKTLGRPVVIYTSADYFTFVNELLDEQFDIAIAGPHFGSMAQARGAKLLFRYQATLQPIIVVRAGSNITSQEQLRGKRIGLSSRLSISSIGGVKWLKDHGLQPNIDYQLIERATHGAAIAGVAVGDLDAALTTHTPLKQMPTDIQTKIGQMPLNIHIPHLMTLTSASLGKPLTEAIRGALRRFPETAEGKKFFADTGYQGYEDITPADIQALQPFVDLTVQMMRQGQ